MTGEQSGVGVLQKLKSLFRGNELEDVSVPSKCPHCGIPTTRVGVTNRNTGSTTIRSWNCGACGNGQNSEPDLDPAEARRNYRDAHRRMAQTAEELINDE